MRYPATAAVTTWLTGRGLPSTVWDWAAPHSCRQADARWPAAAAAAHPVTLHLWLLVLPRLRCSRCCHLGCPTPLIRQLLLPLALQGRRFSRPKRLNAYKEWLKQFAADGEREGAGGGVAGSWLPRQSSDDLLLDTIMLRLRLGDGLDLRQLAASHVEGEEAAERVRAALQPHVERGWVVAGGGGGSGEVQQVLRLADPQGFVVSNDIISDVFAAFDITEED